MSAFLDDSSKATLSLLSGMFPAKSKVLYQLHVTRGYSITESHGSVPMDHLRGDYKKLQSDLDKQHIESSTDLYKSIKEAMNSHSFIPIAIATYVKSQYNKCVKSSHALIFRIQTLSRSLSPFWMGKSLSCFVQIHSS